MPAEKLRISHEMIQKALNANLIQKTDVRNRQIDANSGFVWVNIGT
jgi:hypothetical protein